MIVSSRSRVVIILNSILYLIFQTRCFTLFSESAYTCLCVIVMPKWLPKRIVSVWNPWSAFVFTHHTNPVAVRIPNFPCVWCWSYSCPFLPSTRSCARAHRLLYIMLPITCANSVIRHKNNKTSIPSNLELYRVAWFCFCFVLKS